MLLLLLVVAVVQGKTVRYSNVPPRAAIATKTYDLEVPGSAPIRIIEAEPIWSSTDHPSTTLTDRDDLEHRTLRRKAGKNFFTTQPTRTTLSEPAVTQEPESSTVYSADALNAFLKEYAAKVKADRKKFVEEEEATTEEPINKLASIYLENEKKINDDDKSKSWGLVDVQRHKHPFDDKKGWVTLEAVPWSASKISKWQSNNKNEQKPWENSSNKPQHNWNRKPLNPDTFKDPYFENNNNNKFSNNFNQNNLNTYKFSNNNNGHHSNNNGYNSNTNGNSNSYNSNNQNSNSYTSNSNSYGSNSNKFNTNNYNSNSPSFNNNNFNNYNSNNDDDQYDQDDSIFIDKPTAIYDADIRPPLGSNYEPGLNFPSRPNPQDRPERPQFQRPVYGYDLRPVQVKPEQPDWPSETPSRPSWNKPSSNQWNNNQNNYNSPIPDPWLDRQPASQQFSYSSHSNSDDIITDDRPLDFPKPILRPHPNFEPLQDRPNNNNHPSNHPANGNGEWVLVSTTRGYQYPRSKHQRSIEVTPDSIGTRRGIRLTVLPPGNDTNINMTTSHGGLLEVESTFETVEESQKLYNEQEQMQQVNKTLQKHKKPVRTQVLTVQRPVLQKRPIRKQVQSNTPDATAVLAAVGAGMVPATMAMLVPFVAGRKRRSLELDEQKSNNFSNVPINIYSNANPT